MKGLKLILVIMAAALLTIGLGGMAYAFHDGGVARCEGCHTMHNSSAANGGNFTMFGGNTSSQNPKKGTVARYTGVQYLLQGSDQSSTCLNCHAGPTLSSYHVMTYPLPAAGIGPANLTPGGDFSWLQKTYGTSASGKGERKGHNIVATDFSFFADTTLTTAPGGNYSNNNLSCISCHDPHPSARYDSTNAVVYSGIGKNPGPIVTYGSYGAQATAGQTVGVYRFLGGKGYKPFSNSEAQFAADAPVAVSPSSYNRSEQTTDTRVAYGMGMSEWCANCHAQIHNTQPTGTTAPYIHPTGANALLTAVANIGGNATTIAAIYNAYKSSGDLTGVQATSYWSLVPYEEGVDRATLILNGNADNTGAKTAGPNSTKENVMCLSCHRAHASGFASMGRWDLNAEFITTNAAYNVSTAAGVITATEYQTAMYERLPAKFGNYQRNLCNKCHGKD